MCMCVLVCRVIIELTKEMMGVCIYYYINMCLCVCVHMCVHMYAHFCVYVYVCYEYVRVCVLTSSRWKGCGAGFPSKDTATVTVNVPVTPVPA